jgi:hypothetical protein
VKKTLGDVARRNAVSDGPMVRDEPMPQDRQDNRLDILGRGRRAAVEQGMSFGGQHEVL